MIIEIDNHVIDTDFIRWVSPVQLVDAYTLHYSTGNFIHGFNIYMGNQPGHILHVQRFVSYKGAPDKYDSVTPEQAVEELEKLRKLVVEIWTKDRELLILNDLLENGHPNP